MTNNQNDEARMTRLRQASAWQANDEGMTKPESRRERSSSAFVIQAFLRPSTFDIRNSYL
jgi:hypothetical protein